MIDSASTTIYTYDPRSRLLTESRTINGQAYTLSYQYDAASNLVRLTYPDGYQLSYTYDALNRITSVGNIATLTYRKNNQLATISFGNGVQTAYSYDELGRISRIRTWNSTATLLDLNYVYDLNGNPTSVNNGQETYGYDDLNRLTSANGPFGTLSYTYDQVGNRLSTVVNGTGTSYSYGSYNKLLSAGSTTYSYDNNGNMIMKSSGSNSWSYTYDYQNRLRQVRVNGQLVFQAMYDGDGHRIETVGAGTTVFHYRAGSWDPSYMKDLTSGVSTDVIFAGNFRLGKVQGGVNYYYHLDRLGSVRLVTQSGNVQSFVTKYLPYGNPYATSGSENFQYTGKQLDVPTGLYYYGYRYYDGQSGRFTSLDIQGPDYLNPQSLNRYPYALNNPNRYVDRDGRLYGTPPSPSDYLVAIAKAVLGAIAAIAGAVWEIPGLAEEGARNFFEGAYDLGVLGGQQVENLRFQTQVLDQFASQGDENVADFISPRGSQSAHYQSITTGRYGGHLLYKYVFEENLQAEVMRAARNAALERAAAKAKMAAAHLDLVKNEIDPELAGASKYGFGPQPTTTHGGHLTNKILFDDPLLGTVL